MLLTLMSLKRTILNSAEYTSAITVMTFKSSACYCPIMATTSIGVYSFSFKAAQGTRGEQLSIFPPPVPPGFLHFLSILTCTNLFIASPPTGMLIISFRRETICDALAQTGLQIFLSKFVSSPQMHARW